MAAVGRSPARLPGRLDAAASPRSRRPRSSATATESGANVFRLDYFGRPAYLAQRPQFYKQILVGVFERVYEVGPVFRAEPHDTARHLAEYVSLDVEIGFIEDHRDVLAVLREAVAGMLAAVRERPGGGSPAGRRGAGGARRMPVIHFSRGARRTGAPADEPDLAPAHERALGEWARREHGNGLPRGRPAIR